MKLLDKMESNRKNIHTDIDVKDNANISDFVKTVHDVLTFHQPESKSLITNNNAYGMIQAMNFNNYMEETLGIEFRITVLDKFVYDKCKFILSVDGKGMNKILEGISSLQPIIQSAMPPSITERMVFGDRDKQVKR